MEHNASRSDRRLRLNGRGALFKYKERKGSVYFIQIILQIKITNHIKKYKKEPIIDQKKKIIAFKELKF